MLSGNVSRTQLEEFNYMENASHSRVFFAVRQ